MGEIDRINPILRPLLQPKPADRVHPSGADKRHHHQPEDSVELGGRQPADEEEAAQEDGQDHPPQPPEHGLDLSI